MAAVTKNFEIALDIADAVTNRAFTVVEGDSGNLLTLLVTDGGYPVDLTGCRVIAVFSNSHGTAAQDSGEEKGGVTIGGTLNNQVTINLFSSSVAAGVVECELQIYSDDALSTLVTTARFNFGCRKAIMDEDTLSATAEYPVLGSLIKQVEALKGETEAVADRAETAAEHCEGLANGSVCTWRIIKHGEE